MLVLSDVSLNLSFICKHKEAITAFFPLGIMYFTVTHVTHEHTQLAQAEIFQIA